MSRRQTAAVGDSAARAGVVMRSPNGAVTGGGGAGVALLIGRRGIKGVIGVLWQGDQAPAGAGG